MVHCTSKGTYQQTAGRAPAPLHRANAPTQVILSAHLPHTAPQALGSRTTGQAKTFCDLDLAVLDDLRFSDRELATARYALEESALPIRGDLVRWSQLPQTLRSVIE